MINYSKMKAPGDKRNTWMGGIIQIHITRACDLACTACTQGSNLAGKPVMITLENFEKAVKSLKDYFGVVGIFGGNPTMHPQFAEICEILAKHISFEHRGLWSNNLRQYGKLCRKIFNPKVSNLNVHTNSEVYNKMKEDWPECNPIGLVDSRHSPPYVAMNDLDLSTNEMEHLIENCDINQLWSAMLCQVNGNLKAYFCEIAGAQAMLLNDDSTGHDVDENWWKYGMQSYASQVQKHCFKCGVPLRGKGDLAVNGTKEYVSKTYLPIYKLKKQNSRGIVIVDKLEQLEGKVNRATDYINNGRDSMNPNRVMICVPTSEFARRADFYDYFNMLDKPEGTMQTFAHGQSPARNRNLMIRTALDNNATHCLFLDDDMAFSPNLLKRLLAHDKDIVGGLYLMRNYPHLPVMFDEAYDDGKCRFSFLSKDKHGLVRVVNTGLGACLIKTDVFKNMPEPWITLGECEKDHWCDDIAFFNRARKAGYELYVDLDARCGHMMTAIIWPNQDENGNWHTAYGTSGTASFQVPQHIPSKEELEAALEKENSKVLETV